MRITESSSYDDDQNEYDDYDDIDGKYDDETCKNNKKHTKTCHFWKNIPAFEESLLNKEIFTRVSQKARKKFTISFQDAMPNGLKTTVKG